MIPVPGGMHPLQLYKFYDMEFPCIIYGQLYCKVQLQMGEYVNVCAGVMAIASVHYLIKTLSMTVYQSLLKEKRNKDALLAPTCS